jgi:hypothetical protein
MPILGIWASSFRSAAGPVGAYDALATVTVPSGGVATVSFVGIPAGYKHLQIRGIARSAGSTADSSMTFNSDSSSGSYFANHQIYGEGLGSTIASASPASTKAEPLYTPGSGVTSNVFAGFVVDILDYQNTNKNKTVRSLAGWDANANGYIVFRSCLWMKTDAISRIDWTVAGNWAEYSQFALYGVK